MNGKNMPNINAISGTIPRYTPPDYGQEMFLRYVENTLSRLTDKEWERVRDRETKRRQQ